MLKTIYNRVDVVMDSKKIIKIYFELVFLLIYVIFVKIDSNKGAVTVNIILVINIIIGLNEWPVIVIIVIFSGKTWRFYS